MNSASYRQLARLLCLLGSIHSGAPSALAQEATVLRVRQDGADNAYESLADAIKDIPKNPDRPYIIEFRDNGTYEETVSINKNTTSDFTITVLASAGRTPTIVAKQAKRHAIQIKSPYVTIEGLTIRGKSRSEAVHLSWSSNNTIRGCTISGAVDRNTSGIFVQGGANNQILSNEIFGNAVGLLLFGDDGDDNLVANNVIHDNALRGVWLYRFADGNRILSNTLYHNGTEIQMGSGGNPNAPGVNNVFRHNVVVAGNGGVCFQSEDADVASGGDDDDDGGGRALPSGTVSDYNDLYAGASGSSVGRIDGQGLADLDAWQSRTGVDAHSLSVDPLLVDPGTDMHLQSTGGSFHGGAWTADAGDSPAIDAGNPGTSVGDETDPNGGRINLGAYGGTAQASRSAVVATPRPRGAFNNALARRDGSGRVDVSIEVNHRSGSDTRAKVEHGASREGPFAAASLAGPTVADFDDSGGSPDIATGAYQVGSGTDTRIVTSEGSNTVTFVWSGAADRASGDGTVALRLTVNDDSQDQQEPDRIAVTIDNADPVGLASFAGDEATAESISWTWTPVTTESNFDGYEVWYGTDSGDVQSRSGSATEWDADQDGDLARQATRATTITGLSRGTSYFARIWARDSFGNEATTDAAQFATAGLDTITHYVAKTGAQDGTANDPGRPWNTIQRAVNAIPKRVTNEQSNYVVEILDSGTYDERVTIDKNTNARYSVILRAAAGQFPTVAAPNRKHALILKTDYVIVDGLDILASNKLGVDINTTVGAVVRNCVIRGTGRDEGGVRLHKTTACRLEDNRIYGHDMAVHMSRAATASRLSNNLILGDGSRARGVFFDRDSRQDSLVNNTIVGFERGLEFLGGNHPAGDGHVLRNTIFHEVETAIHLNKDLGSTFALCDYNDLNPTDGGAVGYISGTTYESLDQWSTATGLDGHSLSLDPLFADAAASPASMDLHVQSQAGRWDGNGWVRDASTSLAIDAGHPRDIYRREPAPNGNRINLGAYGNTAEASRSGAITMVLSGVPYDQYLNMGVPLIPVDGNPDSVLSDDFPGEGEDPWGFWWGLVRWDTERGGYLYYKEDLGLEGNPPDFAPGRGFWLIQWWSLLLDDGSTQGDTVTVTGTPVSVNEDFVIPLQTSSVDLGVNQLANPFAFDTDWADAKIRDNGSGRIVTVAQAARAGVIDGHAYLWDWAAGDGAGEYVPLPAERGGRISAWRGFWVEQLDMTRDLDLLLPPIEATESLAKPAASRPTADDWHMAFAVATPQESDVRLQDTNNRAGVQADASHRDDRHDAVHLPGLASPFLYAYFPHDDPSQPIEYWPDRPGRYTYDVRDPDWEEQEWIFHVETDQLSTPLIWTWTNPGQLPTGYVVALEDAETDSVLIADLTQQGSHRFDSGPQGLRQFRLRAQFDDIPGDVTGDRLVDEADALAVLRHAVGAESLPDFALPLAQVSGDEAIATAHDAAWILRLYAGLVDALPVSKSEVPPPAASPAVHLGEPSRRLDGLWELPLVLLDAGDVLSGEISLAYDADVVAIQEMRVEEPAFTTAHATGEGRVAFAFAAATSPAERFVLARLTAGSQATAAELFDHVRIESVELNEGQLSTSLLSPRPAAYALYPPNPNPFNSSVALRFGLPEAGPVEVLLFNAIGQRVATLASDTREAGIYRLTWDGRDAAGRAMASGVYLVQLQAGARRLTTKVTLLR